MMKAWFRFLMLSTIVLSLCACSLFNGNPCRRYVSDGSFFRATAVAQAVSSDFATEKALFAAKASLAHDIDAYILDRYDHNDFRTNPASEAEITKVTEVMLSDINIVCSQVTNRKGMYKAVVAIEVSKSQLDAAVSTIVKTRKK